MSTGREQYESIETADARHEQYASFLHILLSYSPPKRAADPPVDLAHCLAYYEALRSADVCVQDKRTRMMRPHAMYYAAKALDDFDRMAYALGEYCVLASIPAADIQPNSIASRHNKPAQDYFQEVAWPFEELARILLEIGNPEQARQVLNDGAAALVSLGLQFDKDSWFSALDGLD